MKLYTFRPQGHGQYTFSVIAESEDAARNAVSDHVNKNHFEYEADGWNTDYYKMEVYDSGKVSENDNL